jgi:hypothetical protein
MNFKLKSFFNLLLTTRILIKLNYFFELTFNDVYVVCEGRFDYLNMADDLSSHFGEHMK